MPPNQPMPREDQTVAAIMIRLDLKSVRYDRMNDGVQFDTTARSPALVVEVSRQALEDHFSVALDPDIAVLKAVEIQVFIQQAANRIPADDGKIRLTTATLNGRDWE
ncbi:MAG: hypothetical protein AAGE61_20530 [Pseudomonadota bacterium]